MDRAGAAGRERAAMTMIDVHPRGTGPRSAARGAMKRDGESDGGDVMNFVALKMLVGDRLKYISLVAGIAFAALLVTQQASIFTGLRAADRARGSATRRWRTCG